MAKSLCYNEVRDYINTKGYILLDEMYHNTKTKLNLVCSKGHKCSITFDNFKNNNVGCRKCYHAKSNTTQKRSGDAIRKTVEDMGYTLVDDLNTYENDSCKVSIKCKNGHILFKRVSKIKSVCDLCRKHHIVDNKQRNEFSYIKNYIEEVGYMLLTGSYYHGKQKLSIRCDSGHIFNMVWNNFQQGQRCPVCFSQGRSYKEESIGKYISNLIDGVILRDRSTVINPLTNRSLELDVWIPSLNKAIEFNGDYWHNTEITRKRDNIKKEQCKIQGIELLVIDEKEYDQSPDQYRSKIKEFVLS